MATGKSFPEQLRAAIHRDGRSLYALAKASGLRYSLVHRIANNERDNMTVTTAAKLAATMGFRLDLRPARRGNRK